MKVDAVITWVDGRDPKHSAKRRFWLNKEKSPLHENATDEKRWEHCDELSHCIKSIETHAPWFRKIWVVTDDQTPKLFRLKREFRKKVHIVDHSHIFRGHEDVLPCFNSISIETMLFRIEGLADNFVYFNDDVFLVGPVKKSHFFIDGKPILRGQWVDFSDTDADRLHRFNKINAAQLQGFGADHFFASAHTAFPMKRTVLEELFYRNKDLFFHNASFRFRSHDQFLTQNFHNLYLIKNNNCFFSNKKDYIHIKKDNISLLGRELTWQKLQRLKLKKIRIACVNDFEAIRDEFPAFVALIQEVTGYETAIKFYLSETRAIIRQVVKRLGWARGR